MVNKKYTGKDIKVLSDRDHVRKRTQIYLGNTHSTEYPIPLFIDNTFSIQQLTFIPAVYKAVNEIIDNGIDEFAHITTKNKHLQIEADPLLGRFTIADNGRGIPIEKHETGKHTPEVALGSLRSGRNFSEDREAGVIGQNGVGSACTNFCSLDFQIKINRSGKVYKQTFSEGALNVTKPSIRRTPTKNTGTEVSFVLDPEVFSDITLPEELIHNRAIEIALTNPGVTVSYNKQKYKFTKGFDTIINKLGAESYYTFKQDNMEFHVIFGLNDDVDEKIFTYVNSSLLFDGGLCNTQFTNAFFDKVVKAIQPQAKKHKAEVNKNDVRAGLMIFGNLKISNPEFDAQSKTRLTGPNLRADMQKMVDAQWKSFARQNKDWLEEVLERAMERYHSKANKKAVKDHQKSLKKKVPGLIDATSKVRGMCQLLVTEGLSAASMITEARDPKTTASLALTGKVNNVYGITVAQLLKMGKITDLITSVGLIPGKKAIRSELNFGKVVIATDSDVDGADIFTLLVNIFYQFWPELFDSNYDPFIYRLIAPNVCLVKGKTRIHFPSLLEYEKKKGRYRGYEVKYFKGLGSMNRIDWDMILSGKTDMLIPITDDGKIKETLKLLFKKDHADERKKWLQDE